MRSGDGAPRAEAEYQAKVEALASVITALVSRVGFGRAELIDHIRVSHRLAGRIAEAGTGLPEHRGDALVLPSVDEDPRKRVGTPGSDHAPVWVRV